MMAFFFNQQDRAGGLGRPRATVARKNTTAGDAVGGRTVQKKSFFSIFFKPY